MIEPRNSSFYVPISSLNNLSSFECAYPETDAVLRAISMHKLLYWELHVIRLKWGH